MNCKEVREVEVNNDIFMEYESQLRYLEKSVCMLKKNLEKDQEIHKQDNIRIMKNNVKLIREINRLRREVKNHKGSEKSETLLQRKRIKMRQAQRMKDKGIPGDDLMSKNIGNPFLVLKKF